MALVITSDKFDNFRKYLEQNGYTFEERPYQQFLARKQAIVVNLYNSGKIVFGGSDADEKKRVEEFLDSLNVVEVVQIKKEYAPIEVSGTRIGTDEVGKGDYFGPLVIGGVIADESQVEKLRALGIKDSKTLSDITIQNLSVKIRHLLKSTQYEVIIIGPLKYNLLHQSMKNVNGILGWGHARAIENLLNHNPECQVAVADQFGDQSYIEKALMKLGKKIELIQTPKAEREIAVAAASILARSAFIDQMRVLNEDFGLEFPKGATDVIPTAEQFVKIYGSRGLLNVAKIHFSTTRKILNIVLAELQTKEVDLPSQEELPTVDAKISRDTRLECYNLIDSFEPDFRRFIGASLKTYYGTEWWKKCVDENVRKKADGLRQKELKQGIEVELIDCLEMDHYRMIITDKSNWKDVFEKRFRDKDGLLARLKILKDIRNPVAHSRGTLKHADKLGVISAIQWIKDKIK